MPAWYRARVVSNQAAADGLFALGLDVAGTPLPRAYRRPGQYVALLLPGHEEGLFAIASAPDPAGGHLELLVKRSPGLAEALSTLPPGSELDVGPVQGDGFPVERA